MDPEELKRQLLAYQKANPDGFRTLVSATGANLTAAPASSYQLLSPIQASSVPAPPPPATADPFVRNAQRVAFADQVVAQRTQAAYRPPVVSSTIPRDPNERRIREQVYREAGLTDPVGDTWARESTDSNIEAPPQPNQIGYDASNSGDPLRGDRLPAMAARNVSAQEEATRRQGIRDQFQLPIGENVANGKTGRDVFQDYQGRIEGPKQLKERLISEGWSQNDASMAAGQRYNDMFSPKPGTFGYTGPSAVQKALEKGRDAYAKGESLPVGQRAGDIAAALKEARKANLEALTAERMADPNRKPVGLVTAIESNGQVIAKRGEGDARVINAGTYAGNVESVPGKMELTPAGERMVRDRITTAQFNREAPLGGVNAMSESISGTAVTGRYGTAVGRQTSLVDELKASGKLPADFKLTDAQKTGQAPLPDALVEARKGVLGEAKTAAEKGTVSDPATRIAMGIAGGDGVARIDSQADNAARMETAAAGAKQNDAALRSMYSPQQMASLDKAIGKANKTGGEVFDKGGGNFGVRKKKPMDIKEEISFGTRRL